MAQSVYRYLQGMELDFVFGVLEERPEMAIGYTVMFKLSLDFTHFVQMANVYIPGYLNGPINAIRPELAGLGYHYAYNYFFDAAGKMRGNEDLFKVFRAPEYYFDDWSDGLLIRRYGKPEFEYVDGQLQMTARQDFRLSHKRQIQISDLPVVQFQWALHLLEGHTFNGDQRAAASFETLNAPTSVVVFGSAQEDLVPVEGDQMLRGSKYLVGRELNFGPITADRVRTAGTD
ncbi:hypothetical protein GIW70_00215 [Pseudomonas syringae]|nr:hypothetical protein [Pseudomonas syringae]MCF5066619.1 hypothetical protein [Pseudomonas syringae]